MKKVLTLSLFLALFAVSVSAQNEKTERLRRHRIEQRLENGSGHFRQPGTGMYRWEIIKNRLMKQRMLQQYKQNIFRQRELRQHRKMMIRRHYLHRRVI